MLRLIYAERGKGKTTLIHKALFEAVKKENGAMLIVPKQYTFDSDKAVLELMGPKIASSVEVLSFSRLCDLCSSHFGISEKPIVKASQRAVFMSLAIESLSDRLKVFKYHSKDFSFITKLLSQFDELKNCGIMPSNLMEISEKSEEKMFKEKLSEIALIFSAYEAIVSQSNLDDSDILLKSAEVLFENDFFKDKTVAIDGFSYFSFGEMKIIETIMKSAKEVYVTLTTDDIMSNDPLTPFQRVNAAGRSLIRLAGKNSIEVTCQRCEYNPELPKDIEFLRDNFLRNSYETYENECENIFIFKNVDIISECDKTARKIKSFIRTEKYRSRDISVVYRNEESYERLIKASFKKFGVPFFESRREPIEKQPLIVFVLSLIKYCTLSVQRENILRILKTGLFSFEKEEISLLENYTFMWDIDGKKWLSPWSDHPRGFGKEFSAEDEKLLERINDLRERAVLPLQRFKESVEEENPKEFTASLYNFLRKYKIDDALKNYAIALEDEGFFDLAREQEQVWDVLMEVFDETALALGERKVDLKRYSELFSLVISEKTLGKLPDGFDEVYLCSAERIATKQSKVVFVLGLNSGVFPLDAPPQGIISQREKDRIFENGFDISGKTFDFVSGEKYLSYSAVTSGCEKVFLSYVTAALSGEKQSESSVIGEIKKLFPTLKEETFETEKFEDLIESEVSAFQYMAKNWKKSTPEEMSLKEYFKNKDEYKDRLSAIERAVNKKSFAFSNNEKSLELFGKDMVLSASQIENYFNCPFKYFCRYGVKAYKLEKARLDSRNYGTIIHYCLEAVLSNHSGREFLDLSAEEIEDEIAASLKDYLEKKLSGEENKTERFTYLYMRSKKIVLSLIEKLKDEFSSGDYSMSSFELSIGDGKTVEPMVISLEEGSCKIIGSIDRVDQYIDGNKKYVRVVDYKTGKKVFSLSDAFQGLNLQMLLYLMSVVGSQKDLYKDSIPAGILYSPANVGFLDIKRGDKEEKIHKDKLKALSMNGMIIGDEVTVRRMASENISLFLPVKENKSGQILGSIISLKDFERLSVKLRELVKEMGDSLQEGIIPAKPAVGSNCGNICDNCDYKSVCMREEKGDYRFIENFKSDEVLKMLREESDEA